jgi:O-antigen/teichoic acid export membrane protein
MSTNYKEKNFKKLQEISQNTFKVLFAFWIWVIALWLVFKDYIVKLIANPNYLEVTDLNKYTSSDAFSIVFFMLLFFYLWLVFSYLLVATERQNRLLKISIILTLVNIIWNIVLIPYLSFIWAWIVTVFTQILFLVLAYFFSRDVLKFKFPIKYIVLVIFSALLLHIIAKYLNSNLSLWGYYNLIYAFW